LQSNLFWQSFFPAAAKESFYRWNVRAPGNSGVLRAIENRVARFFFVQYTKAGENIPDDYDITKMTLKYTPWP
jgi:hypothetical protein